MTKTKSTSSSPSSSPSNMLSTSIKFRVACYNVLSSSLCSFSYFNQVTNEKFCSSDYRYQGLTKKLDSEISKNSVVCLQEVSINWTGKLVTYFEDRDYNFIFSNYGKSFNGFMGVGIAYPRNKYHLVNSDIICVPETKVGGWGPKRQYNNNNNSGESSNIIVRSGRILFGSMKGLFRGIFSTFRKLFNVLLLKDDNKFPRGSENPWDLARGRVNMMVAITLRPNGATEEDRLDFLVSTYHMPCQFYEPATMSIHTAICLQKLQQLSKGIVPYVLAGDFNFKPNSPQYAFTTTGILPQKVDDPSDLETHGKLAIPENPLYENDTFKFHLPRGALKSAYAEVLGQEPEFTNYALTGDMPKPFQGTLDYIFYGSGEKNGGKTSVLKAVDVLDLTPVLSETKKLKSLPSETEYSDHLMIAADFELELH